MKNLLALLFTIFTITSFTQTTAIPDQQFEHKLQTLGLDNTFSYDGLVLTANIDTLTVLDLSTYGAADLTGIQDFTALKRLSFVSTNVATADLSQNTNLEFLDCYNSILTTLNLGQNTNLKRIYCGMTNITSLDVSQNPNLSLLSCYDCPQLTNLNVSQNPVLDSITVYITQLTSLDISNCPSLSFLFCDDGQIGNLDVTHNSDLKYLMAGQNLLTSIDVAQNSNLNLLSVHQNQLTNLNISLNNNLTSLSCSYNQLTCLNAKNGNNNNFTRFIASSNPNLTCIEVDNLAYSNSNWLGLPQPASYYFDSHASFSANCGNSCTVGVKEYESIVFSIHPNPVKSLLFIEDGLSINELKISDISGRNYNVIKKTTSSIDVSELPNGIYFLETIDVSGNISTNKFIKN
jgi:Leucine-rich repeat (LRR) protein